MALSNDLIAQFVKLTRDETPKATEATVYGTVKEQNGTTMVQLDGSDVLTPVSSTVKMKAGERVLVSLKNHSATVTGNLTVQAARSDDVEALKGSVITVEQLNANYADIDFANISDAAIERLNATYATIANLNATNAKIDNLDATYATIESLKATEAKIDKLDSKYITTDFANIGEAAINMLDARYATIENLDAYYANIDFANIGDAAIENLFAKAGIIGEMVVNNGIVSGTLVGVTIKGDLIEADTIVADRIIFQGEDGLYYRLNTDGMTIEAEQTEYNSIHGSIIAAHTIAATKIAVSDLVAFDATIGGFKITEDAIYSGVKESPTNTTRGSYLDNEGQVGFGDTLNFLRYYKDQNENYKLEIAASSLTFSASGMSAEDAIGGAQASAGEAKDVAKDADDRAIRAEASIKMLSDSLEMLVTGSDGSSLMTQTENGWTFAMGNFQSTVEELTAGLNALNGEYGDTKAVINDVSETVKDLAGTAEYIRIRTFDDHPCVELGESDSELRLRVTNERIMFSDGPDIQTYINHKGLTSGTITVENETRLPCPNAEDSSEWVWKNRGNGNLGLTWREVTE